MADIAGMLDEIQHRALREEVLREKILNTRNAKDPLEAFCKICREYGYEIYEMDVICAGEEFHAAMKRSTNGGGENSPMLGEEDDFYEMFMVSLHK
ncbi:MAG: hypothetical protein U0L05_02835 [Schaedlerella sp.]|nr:hypothetical protein [Schaedlerella sp.]